MTLIIFVVGFLSLLVPSCLGQFGICCPRVGPNGLYLQLQQTAGIRVFCNYGLGPIFRQCAYSTIDGSILTSGCPPFATNPSGHTFCPVTNVLHPKLSSTHCVEVRDARYEDGTPVQINTCNGQNHQKFVLFLENTGHIQVAGTNFCLDVGPTPRDGTGVVIRKCNDDTFNNQHWFYDHDDVIIHADTGLYLGVPNGRITNGNQLDIEANGDGPNVQWFTYP